MTKVNKKYKSLIGLLVFFVVLSILLFLVGWYLTMKTNKEVSKIATEAKYLAEESNKWTEVVQKYNRVSDFEPVVYDSLPTSKEISSFLADVESLANKNGIKINQTTIGTSNNKTKQTNLDMSQTISQKDYYELQIKYTVEGSYMGFLQMISDMTNMRRLNTISEVNIIKNSTGTDDVVQVNFTDSIFIKK